MLKRIMLGALAILVVCAAPALAGKHNGGAMVVHTDDSVIYTATDNYCNTALPATCAQLNPTATQGVDREQVIWIVAAFDPGSSPAVTTVQFGVDHNLPANQGYITAYGACGPSPLELKDGGWPETGFGNLLAFGSPVNTHLFSFYWFAVFVDDANNYFGTRSYPSTGEAKFVDDGNPPIEDLISRFGTVKFGGTIGVNACPVPPLVGACCLGVGGCQVLNEADCQAVGVYLGDNTTCGTVSCGSCCFWNINNGNFGCVTLTETLCNDRYSYAGSGGLYQDPHWAGAGTWCPEEEMQAYCQAVPTTPTSWGHIKAMFR